MCLVQFFYQRCSLQRFFPNVWLLILLTSFSLSSFFPSFLPPSLFPSFLPFFFSLFLFLPFFLLSFSSRVFYSHVQSQLIFFMVVSFMLHLIRQCHAQGQSSSFFCYSLGVLCFALYIQALHLFYFLFECPSISASFVKRLPFLHCIFFVKRNGFYMIFVCVWVLYTVSPLFDQHHNGLFAMCQGLRNPDPPEFTC